MSETANKKTIWKVIGASSMGTLIEWYDFFIFGSLAVVISTKFFPADNPTAAFLSTLATFAAGTMASNLVISLRNKGFIRKRR